MCNKISFKSKSDARKYLKVISSRGLESTKKKKVSPLIPYECHYCGEYHLTSLNKKESKRITRKTKLIKSRIRKVEEVRAIKSVSEKWEWLALNQADWMTLHHGDRSYLTFEGLTSKVLMN